MSQEPQPKEASCNKTTLEAQKLPKASVPSSEPMNKTQEQATQAKSPPRTQTTQTRTQPMDIPQLPKPARTPFSFFSEWREIEGSHIAKMKAWYSARHPVTESSAKRNTWNLFGFLGFDNLVTGTGETLTEEQEPGDLEIEVTPSGDPDGGPEGDGCPEVTPGSFANSEVIEKGTEAVEKGDEGKDEAESFEIIFPDWFENVD